MLSPRIFYKTFRHVMNTLLHALILIVSKLYASMHVRYHNTCKINIIFCLFYNSYNSEVILASKTYLNNMLDIY